MLVYYAVFGVNLSKSLPERLVYLVEAEEGLNEQEVFKIIEMDGIAPNAYGLSTIVDYFANYYVVQLNELDYFERNLYEKSLIFDDSQFISIEYI